MVNICESAIKIVNPNKRKWFTRLSQTGNETEAGRFSPAPTWPYWFPVNSRHLTQHTFHAERGNPVRFPLGQLFVRTTYDLAGLGCRKKRRPGGNRLDRAYIA